MDGSPSEVSFACRELLSQAFAPNVAVTASDDTHKLCKDMGVDSLLSLLQPFGDKVTGKLTVRDSQNISLAVEDFAVRFGPSFQELAAKQTNQELFDVNDLETYLQHRLGANDLADSDQLYTEMFSRVISAMPVQSFETFSHPVANVIAISSKNEQPIDTLSALYQKSQDGAPEFMSKDFLRYYVLIHDDQSGDVEKSTALFEKMKRHFGLHCHMLRINRPSDDSDSENTQAVKPTYWLGPTESLKTHRNLTLHNDDVLAIQQFVRELVASSVVPFMERCVATWNDQVASSRRGFTGRFFSASKKYFASANKSSSQLLSSSFLPTGSSNSSPTRGNYSVATNSYHASSPEAQLRKLADFAFMLRDYRCAYTTYDLLKRDFHNDKAWSHLAAAQEMAALSWLLHRDSRSPITSKSKNDTLEPLLDSATYSYISRCSLPTYALRCIMVSSELMCTQFSAPPSIASESSTKWILKALNDKLVGRLGYALLMQQVSNSFAVHDEITLYNGGAVPATPVMSSTPSASTPSASAAASTVSLVNPLSSSTPPPDAPNSPVPRVSSSSPKLSTVVHKHNSSRLRKAAFWSMLAAREWDDAKYPAQVNYCLDKSDEFSYSSLEWTASPTGLKGRLRRSTAATTDEPEVEAQSERLEGLNITTE